jgi:hypothetical protein
MEIISYVISGALTHKDSIGNSESLGRGGVQYMSAGTGVMHSETNEGDEAVHLIQTWIVPVRKGLKPQYGSRVFDKSERHNRWLHLAGPEESDAVIHIYQDANMYASEMDSGQKLRFDLQPGRQLYLKVMEGDVRVNGTLFAPGDAAEVEDESLDTEALSDAHLLIVEMKKS